MKKLMQVLLALVLMVSVVGCGTKTPTEETYEKDKTEQIETEKQTPKDEKASQIEEDKKDKKDKKDEKDEAEAPVIDRALKVAAPVGAPLMTMAKMMTENKEIHQVQFDYEVIKSPETLAARIISEELDMVIVPSNLAIKLYNKGVPYQYAGAGVWGVLYLATSEEGIKDWSDLKGKTINMIGRGLTPDIVFRLLLEKNGLDPDKDVTLNYVNGASELAQFYLGGKSTLTVMPEPMLTKVRMKKKETKVVFDLQDEWSKLSDKGGSYPQAALIIKKELINQYPELIAEFVANYQASVEWVNQQPAEAGQAIEKMDVGLKAKIIEKAIPGSHLMFKNATDSREDLEYYYGKLYEFSPKAIGGKLPDDAFYYQP